MYYFNTKYSLIFVLKIQKEFHCFLKGDCAKNYATLFVKALKRIKVWIASSHCFS